MILSFKHRGLEQFFTTGSKAGIQPKHASKLEEQLTVLDDAVDPSDMNLPGWHLHSLKGDMEGQWSVRVSGNWRLTFRIDDGHATVVNYHDYH